MTSVYWLRKKTESYKTIVDVTRVENTHFGCNRKEIFLKSNRYVQTRLVFYKIYMISCNIFPDVHRRDKIQTFCNVINRLCISVRNIFKRKKIACRDIGFI